MAQSLGTAVPQRRPVSAGLADVALPVVILLAVLVVVAPVPQPVVDLLLAANLTVSVLALLGALAARTPLEMSVFPTFLLGATLVRLVLNIATTRLILSRAAVDGTTAAGARSSTRSWRRPAAPACRGCTWPGRRRRWAMPSTGPTST